MPMQDTFSGDTYTLQVQVEVDPTKPPVREEDLWQAAFLALCIFERYGFARSGLYKGQEMIHPKTQIMLGGVDKKG